MPSVSQIHYELITLGDELLLGLTANGHLTYIGSQLGRRGALLRRNVTVTDEADDIAAEFASCWARADVVITTGGLGPTCDDRTREAIAGVLGTKLVFSKEVEAEIQERFARLGRPMTPNNLNQAYVFEDGEILHNPNGTAPGLWFEREGKVLCMLPGPPSELHPMFEDQILPRLQQRGLLGTRDAFVQLRTAGIGESALETLLNTVFQREPKGLSVAYCAHAGQVDVRLSSPEGLLNEGRLQQIAAECAILLGEHFFCFGHDTLTRRCADLLRARHGRLAIAEAATGGMLADSFTSTGGCSKIFAGSAVCTSTEALTQMLEIPEEIMLQHGEAGAETAQAMATGIAEKLGAEYALAVTAFGSGSSQASEQSPGYVHIALYSPNGVWSRKLCPLGPRGAARQRIMNAALDWLRRELMRCGRGSCV